MTPEIINLLQKSFLNPWFYLLIGLCVGSFINVVVYRLPQIMMSQWKADAQELLELPASTEDPQKISLSSPASRCPHCGHQIAWYENIPVLSWLFLKGKCSACKKEISVRYPLVEASCGLLFLAIGLRYQFTVTSFLLGVVGLVLICAALIDWDTMLLPDEITLPLMWAGIVCAYLGYNLSLAQAVLGAMVGYVSLWLLYQGFKLLTKKDAMGYGDFKLLAALGAWMGAGVVPIIVVGASVVFILIAIVKSIKAQDLQEVGPQPYGPCLAIAGITVMLIGPSVITNALGWYF